ncbi:MAG TPA: asparaginase [Bacillota bacterium]|nr:asparaginase [Bacillota bacterium]
MIIIKKIAVITTGGTIAMKADHTGLASPSLSGDDLIAAIPSLKERAAVDVFAFCNVPSSYLTMDHLVRLKSYIKQLEEQGYAGVVITHGTDTMEETAYFLDLTLQSSIPVVLTGAQRNPSLVSSDGPANLLDSILVAADDRAHEMGVLIVFASEIVAAREATKFHRTRVDTFKSLEFGPLGAVNNDRVIWYRKPQRESRYIVGKADKRVDIVSCYIGADSAMILSSLERGAEGIVIEALGAGHVTPAMLQGIKSALEKGVPVVLTSRVPVGRLLTDTYGYEGGEKHLRSLGVILGEDLSAWKARIKLIVLLSAGLSPAQIRREFEHRLYG